MKVEVYKLILGLVLVSLMGLLYSDDCFGYEYEYTWSWDISNPEPESWSVAQMGSGWKYYVARGHSGDATADPAPEDPEQDPPPAQIDFSCLASAYANADVLNLSSGSLSASHQSGSGVREWWDWTGPAGSEPNVRFVISYEYGGDSGASAEVHGEGVSSDQLGPGCAGCSYAETNAGGGMAGNDYEYPIVDFAARGQGGGYLGGTAFAWGSAYIDPELSGDWTSIGDSDPGDYIYGGGASVGVARHVGSFGTTYNMHRLKVSRGVSCDALAGAWASSTGGSETWIAAGPAEPVHSGAVLYTDVGVGWEP